MSNKKKLIKELEQIQEGLKALQPMMVRDRTTAVIVLEGWDAAGKGGLIRRLAWSLDPRFCHVWPIGKPGDGDERRHWLQRFWERLPAHGNIAVFDRSWYGRVLVERVEGFAEESAWKRAYGEIRAFERMLVDENIHLIKIFIDITPETQLQRFLARLDEPHKRWKITEEDLRNRAKWDAYAIAYNDMLQETSMPEAPWFVLDGNDKRAARVEGLGHIYEQLSKGRDLTPLDIGEGLKEELLRLKKIG